MSFDPFSSLLNSTEFQSADFFRSADFTPPNPVYGDGNQSFAENYHSKPELVGVYELTTKCIEAQAYGPNHTALPAVGETTKVTKFDIRENQLEVFNGPHDTELVVVEQDGVYAACDLKNRFHEVALLNPASARHRGGGVKYGAGAMEEDLCRRSPLKMALDALTTIGGYDAYPLYKKGTLYTHDVPFFRGGRDQNYRFMDHPVSLSVISSAAPDMPKDSRFKNGDPNHIRDLKERAYLQLLIAKNEGAEAVVLGAFGCGAFCNGPEFVAAAYKEVIDNHFRGVFKNITFAIIDDHNAHKEHNPRGNFLPFKELFQ